LLEIRHQEGETVEVGTAVGILGEEGETAIQSSAADDQKQIETIQVEEPQVVTEELSKPEEVEQTAAVTTMPANVEDSANSANTATSAVSGDSTEVVMPQMGESITEGTISKWLKKVGDKIERDEPLLEISTDKVDAEVPAPAAGTLLEIRYQEGDTVEVGTALAFIGSESGASAVQSQKSQVPSQQQAEQLTAQATGADVSSQKQTAQTSVTMPVEEKKEIEEVEGRSYDYGREGAVEDAQKSSNGQSSNGQSNGNQTIEDLRKTKSSPLVRNIAKEHGIDIGRLAGSGMSGRVTKKDIMSFIESGAALRPEDLLRKGAPSAPAFAPVTQPQTVSQPVQKTQFSATQISASVGDRVEPMSVMRKKIAEHMTFSKQTSAHVTSVYEIDMTNVTKFREKNKADFQSRYGTKLSYMPFIFQATTNALRKFPIVNSQVSGEQIVYKGDINLGMAVALDWGLIVPVIKKADSLSLSGLAQTANDLADRARTKKLMPDEVQGGTFTITNPGVFGGLFGTPIINQPQVAILCVGTIEKRPKVLTTPDGDDYIAIRSMAYFALTYDHRIVDGADAEKFLSFMKQYLETTQFAL
jgi:2-oxoglutarate dehydrogenase E2 component (dihydrolipoamide succinyltransferase)